MIITECTMTLSEASQLAEETLQEVGISGIIDKIKKYFAKFGNSMKTLLEKVKRQTGLASQVDKIVTEAITKANREQKKEERFVTVNESATSTTMASLVAVTALSLTAGSILSKESFVAYVKNSYKHMTESISKAKMENMPKAVVAMLILMCVVTIADIIATVIVMALGFNPATAMVFTMMLGAVVVAPLIEESYKAHSKQYGIYNEAMLLFNIFEFSGYVSNMVRAGVNVFAAIITRLVLVFSHYSMGRQSIKQKIDKDTKTISFTSPGVLQHFTNNFAAVVIAIATAPKG